MSSPTSNPPLTILVVEDDPLIRTSLRRFFEKRGQAVLEATTVAEARKVLQGSRPDAAVFDYQLPDGDGLALLQALRNTDPTVPAVVLTAHGSIDVAVQAMKEGAEQFFTKPVELPTLLLVLQRAVENRRNRQSTLAGRSLATRKTIDPFLGKSPAIRRLAEQARRVADASTTILLQGESGTGKGVLSRWIHDNGPRAAETFVDLNCAGLARDLLESELFGHEKGSFTGAVAGKQGLFEIAHRGTLFLDEVGDADLQVQPKLLKILEEQVFRRVGAVRGRQVDVRLIAATHHDLRELVEQKKFRDDLFYRISAIPLFMPSLRDRGPDIAILARDLLRRISAEMGFAGIELAPNAEKALVDYAWPGNIRELRNVLERAVLLGDRKAVRVDDVTDVLAPRGPARPSVGSGISLEEAERAHIEAVLEEECGDVRKAATVLALSRSALYSKIKKHGIKVSRTAS